MVDLPEDNREAAMNAITLPEVKSYSFILRIVCYDQGLNLTIA